MDRVIKLSELRDAINEAYDEYKNLNKGTVDPRIKDANAESFAISVALPDGTIINKGDTQTVFPMGQISRILEPKGDPESKWNFIENRLIALIGSAPQLDIKLYEELKKEFKDAKAVEAIDNSEYKLADDTKQSVDLYLRGLSMTVNTQQLAEMGATIAADGVNPFTRQSVYDGALSQRLVARLALKSHKLRRFIMKTGLPASAGFGGGVVGVLPGVLSIAAYSPELCDNGVSIKASRAIAYIMKKLNLSVFGSAKVVIEK